MRSVHIDKLGRIVIPIAYRRALGFDESLELEICIHRDELIVRRASNFCKLCYADIDNVLGIGLCQDCIEKIKKI